MPRTKRNANEPPRRLSNTERQQLTWDTNFVSPTAAGETSNANGDSTTSTGERTSSDANGDSTTSTGEGTSSDANLAKKPRLDIPKFDIRQAKYLPYLDLNYFDNTDYNEKPTYDCVFMLYEFKISSKVGQENVYDEFFRRCRMEEANTVRLYHLEGKHRWGYSSTIERPLLYCAKLADVMVPCRVHESVRILELFHQKASFHLTYDHGHCTIRVWVKDALVAKNAIGDGVDPAPCTNLRRLMPLLFPQLCSGHVIEADTSRYRKLDDNPHRFYDELKALRQSMVSSIHDQMELKNPDIIPYLRPYQIEAVRWMLQREKDPKSLMELTNPLFVTIRDVRGSMQVIYYNPYGGYFLREKPPPLSTVHGGILAEEMGLGKTVEMLTLILLNPKNPQTSNATISSEGIFDEDQSPSDSIDLEISFRLQTEEAFRQKALDEIRYQREKQATYKRKIVFKPRSLQDGAVLQCFCGRANKEADPSPRMCCRQCKTWQHASCVRWPETEPWATGENYLCPTCRCSDWKNRVEGKATLIVSPISISDQWYAEIRKHIRKGALSVYIYRGVQYEGFVQPHTLGQYDIVIVAYETLRTELNYVESLDRRVLRKPKRFVNAPSPLGAVKWWRLCLDEAQMVENALAKAAKMCLQLDANYKWCVTGTPIQKSMDDLYGLFLLLDHDPYSIRVFWNEALYLPYVHGIDRRLLTVAAPIVWRTAKADVLDQLDIPEQEHRLRWIEFGPVEEHFYKRIREECFEQFRQVLDKLDQESAARTQRPMDRGKELDELDRVTLDQLLRPLLKLRQACCHPQLVRGRFVNFDQLQQKMRVVTMDAVLDQMIKRTRQECEDYHRNYVASLNGLAALEWILANWAGAAEWYREVLRSCDQFEKQTPTDSQSTVAENSTQHQTDTSPVVRTDLLQKLHALHNLSILVKDHRDGVPPTLRDDHLGTECELLKEKYLFQSSELFEKKNKEFDSAQSSANDELVDFSSACYIDIIHSLARRTEEAHMLVDRFQQALIDTKWQNRFRDLNGLVYLITNHSNTLLEIRKELSNGMMAIRKPNWDELLAESLDCHLRVDGLGDLIAEKKCTICSLDAKFEEYEDRLFDFEPSANGNGNVVAGVNNEHINILGQLRRGTWADSDLEKTLKIVYNLANRSIQRAFIDQNTMEAARKNLKVFDVLKQEFRALRAAWISVRDHVARRDELRMAVDRLSNYAEDVIPMKRIDLFADRNSAQGLLKRQLPQLAYLENLKRQSQQSAQENQQDDSVGNLEECPICRVEFGKNWVVLTMCGHSLCVECHRLLTNNDRNTYCVCPICRRRTPQMNVQQVVFKKSTERAETEKEASKYQIYGDHSAKIQDVVRCIMEIQEKERTAKALVFSNWLEVLALLSKALSQNFIDHVFMNVAGEKWRRNMTKFKTSPECNVMLLALKNGSNGLNIIEATHVLMVDPSLNPAVEQQALGRVHRIGQKKKTTVHRFLIQETVEEKIHAIFADQVLRMDGPILDDSDSNTLTISDLVDLFETNKAGNQQ